MPPLCAVVEVRLAIKLFVVIVATLAGLAVLPPLTQPLNNAITERENNDIKTLFTRDFFVNTYKELLLNKIFIIN